MIERVSEGQKKEVLKYLEERFGMEPGLFRDFGFYSGSKGRIMVGPKKVLAKPKPISAGMVIARVRGAIKPSTNLLQAFGKGVKRNIIQLTREQAVSYCKGEDLELKPGDASDGYVLLKYKEFPLGCGMLREGQLKNMLPKAKRSELEFL